jgi:hypothetical protein
VDFLVKKTPVYSKKIALGVRHEMPNQLLYLQFSHSILKKYSSGVFLGLVFLEFPLYVQGKEGDI